MQYTKEYVLEKLNEYNDRNFRFDEDAHRYTYRDTEFTSVTTFLSRFHKPFDKEFMAERTSIKEGITKEEVLKKWQYKNDYSNILGTATHLWIENYYNKIHQELPTDLDIIKRINKFNIIYSKHLSKLEFIVSEQKIFSQKLSIAGMIDTLFLYKGQLFIVDWKTNLKLTSDKDTKYNKLFFPFSKFWQNHINEYSIQQSLYAYILSEIGLEVKTMYLCYIGPDTDAELIKCVDMRSELNTYFNSDIHKLNIRNKKINSIISDDFNNLTDFGIDL